MLFWSLNQIQFTDGFTYDKSREDFGEYVVEESF